MATSSYEDALRQVRSLSLPDQAKLLAEISRPVETTTTTAGILQLQGLGKEIWKNLGTDEYIRQERSSWTG